VFIKFYEQTYEGHTHYIINPAFNPKDANTFLSACLDRTVKMWSLGSSIPNFSLEAQKKGVNYVDFYLGADKPYLVTTGDDKTVKLWDYLSKSCVQTMEGHTNNVSFAVFHPNLPIRDSSSVALKMERSRFGTRDLSRRKHAQLYFRTCMVCCAPQT